MSFKKNIERLKAFKVLNLLLDHNLLETRRDEIVEIFDTTDNKIIADKFRPIIPHWWPGKKKNDNLTHKRKDKKCRLVVDILMDLLENDGDNRLSHVVLKGKARIGKTTTAINFGNANEEKYKHIIWINCRDGKIRQELENLAKHLKIESTAITIRQLAQNCFQKLSNAGKCLLVFDDADEHNNIQELLPETNNFHTIITTRKSIMGTVNRCGRINVHVIEEFEEEETLEFLQPILTKNKIQFSEHQLKDLHRQLGGLPSALQRLVKAPALLEGKLSIAECTKRKQLINIGVLNSKTTVKYPQETSTSRNPVQSNNKEMMHLPEMWGLPQRNPQFVGRKGLLRKLEEHFNNGDRSLILTACHGLGGVGKTQTALEFAWEHYEEYKGVAWFNAESKDRLIREYIQLSHALRMSLDHEKMSNEDKARYIKFWLEDPVREGWLLIYDNAQNYGGENGINEYLPVRGGNVLITSRYAEGWPESFSVEVFTREESEIFIKEVLRVEPSEEDTESLAETLGDLPLALAQACAYINKNSRINIRRYLQFYEERKEQLFKDKTKSESEGTVPYDSKKAMVFITWDITMEAIKRESILAANWLNSCSYMAPNNIPNFLMEDFVDYLDVNPNSEIYEEALAILSSYSIITVNEENQSTSIHRLVQEVIQLKEEKKYEEFGERWKSLHAAGMVLVKMFPLQDKTNIGLDKINKLMPHFEACVPHLKIHQKNLLQLYPEIEFDITSHFLAYMGDGYSKLGDCEKARTHFEQALAMHEKHYGRDHAEVAVTLSNLGGIYGSLGKAEKSRDMLERSLAINEKNFGRDHVVLAVTLNNLGSAYISLGDTERACDNLERALSINEKHYKPDHFEIADTLVRLGNAYGLKGDVGRKRDILERALAINEKYYGEDNIVVADTLTELGSAYGSLGDAGRKCDLLERALSIQEKYYGPDHITVGLTLTNLGNTYESLEDREMACDMLKRAVAINEKYFGPDHVKVAGALTNLGIGYQSLGEREKARDLQERALRIQENYYGPDHVQVACILKNLGNTYLSLGDRDKSYVMTKRALTINEKYYGSDHVEVGLTLSNLGNVYLSMGQAEKAKGMLERALAINEKYYGAGHVNVSNTLSVLGDTYRILGDAQRARDMLSRALVSKEKYYGPDHIEVGVTLANLANAYMALGDSKNQCDMMKRALSIHEKYYGTDHVILGTILTNLGVAYGLLGEREMARDLQERALMIQEKYYGPDHVEITTTLVNLGNTYALLGYTKKGRDMLERALVINERYYGPDHVNVAITLTNIVNAYGSWEDAEKQCLMLERALRIQEKYYGPDNPTVAVTLTHLGNIYGALGHGKKACDVLERALAIKEIFYGPNHVEVAPTLTNLGVAYQSVEKREKARDLQERALTIQEKYYGQEHIELSVTLTALGMTYGSLGDEKRKIKMLERSLAIEEKNYGNDHVIVAAKLNTLGISYAVSGETGKARDMLERALVINEKYYGPSHGEVFVNLTHLVFVYGLLGDRAKQTEIQERAFKTTIFKQTET